MLNSIKEELKKRREEELAFKRAVENEKKRLEEKRFNARKSIIRKIKFVDNIKTQKEEQADAEAVAKFKLNERQKISSARKKRSAEIVKNNKKTIIVAVCICIALIVGGITAGVQIKKIKTENSYTTAVNFIIQEDYKSAKAELDGIDDYKDSDDLRSFCAVMNDLEGFYGNPEAAKTKLSSLSAIQDNKIEEMVEYAIKQCTLACEVQAILDKIDNQTFIKAVSDISGAKESLKDIKNKLKAIDLKYAVMVDKITYEQLSDIVTNVEKKTDLGKTIVAIYNIGKVKLSKAEQIKDARKLYDNLADSDKEKVLNYKLLTKAETKLDSLIKEKEEAERIAKEEAEQKAREEKEAREQEAARYNTTVYLTATGDCYHIDGCRFLRNTNRPIKRGDAEARGYQPCGICGSGYY